MNLSPEKNSDACVSCEFQENLDRLRHIPFFSALPLESLKIFAYLCKRERFRAGDTLFSRGDDDGQAIFILSGTVAAVRNDGDGDVRIRGYSENEFIGGLALLGESNRIFTLAAETDVVCLILEREKFQKAMKQFPDLTPRIFRTLVKEISAWEENLYLGGGKECPTCRGKLGVSLL